MATIIFCNQTHQAILNAQIPWLKQVDDIACVRTRVYGENACGNTALAIESQKMHVATLLQLLNRNAENACGNTTLVIFF